MLLFRLSARPVGLSETHEAGRSQRHVVHDETELTAASELRFLLHNLSVTMRHFPALVGQNLQRPL